MIYELNHIGIKTANMEASIEFYHQMLGGVIVRDAKSLDGLSRFVYIQMGKGTVELITSQDPADQGFAHVAYLVDEAGLDKAYEILCEKGIEFTVKPKKAGSGDGRLAFFRDPCGVIDELIEREPRPRAEEPDARVISFDHTLIGAGAHWAECMDFYQESMDMVGDKNGRCSKGADALVFNTQEGGILYMALKVADCKALRSELNARGVATQDAQGGFIAVAPSGERVFLFE